MRNSEVAYYSIEDDMESIIEELNRRGQVVVKAKYFDEPVYLKIYATSDKGIVTRHFNMKEYDLADIDEYNF